ncbi:MAG: helix-turn-helix transcriptional regulator [Oscillospiraceae bacterium]|nr:MAG TPA: helix-turn-helix domain protein [Caudoviricetes sp.]
MNFGERLKQLRAVKNLTQKQLAIETETSERGIQNYEMGIRKPAFDVLIALADYFDVSLDYLVGRSDDPTRR